MVENIRLFKASRQYKPIIKNLMQFYVYDFSRFVDLDVGADGLFVGYKGLSDYWTDKNRFPYLIQKGDAYAGFALVRWIGSAPYSHYSMAEFFVMQKYRRGGIGKKIATQLFDLHKGDWEVFQKERNVPAQLFWRTIIDEYTNGDFTERLEDGKKIQRFKSPSSITH